MELEEMLTVHVKIGKTTELKNRDGDSVVMISFTGHVTGKYFEGVVLEGGIDTQVIGKSGDRHSLSARYMLQGRDYTGEACEIYIENNGSINQNSETGWMRTHPKMITNSKTLSFLHHDLLVGEGVPTESGVDIILYRAR